ncbi:DUF6650 family protein [Methylocystis echinoides]|uniref:Uncharacterized protein n=1 Tax=Methylocystis echinoides TaxID=29468 RepID=A0A9W6GZB3_9HYPH|nr:DUF6650 family protein [Methylocystis echinoides]GLI95744.1 hypothetical protein LMG27198_47360 [Methylocystis echinoides]
MAGRFKGTKVKLKGMSLLGIGASFDVSNSDRDTVRGLLTFLEDRRALYSDFHLEAPEQVNQSVHDIRKKCTEALTSISEHSDAQETIRAIRAACRNFLEQHQGNFKNLAPSQFGGSTNHAGFFTALGVLRANIGAQVAALAIDYDIEIEPGLAAILPPDDEDAG